MSCCGFSHEMAGCLCWLRIPSYGVRAKEQYGQGWTGIVTGEPFSELGPGQPAGYQATSEGIRNLSGPSASSLQWRWQVRAGWKTTAVRVALRDSSYAADELSKQQGKNWGRVATKAFRARFWGINVGDLETPFQLLLESAAVERPKLQDVHMLKFYAVCISLPCDP